MSENNTERLLAEMLEVMKANSSGSLLGGGRSSTPSKPVNFEEFTKKLKELTATAGKSEKASKVFADTLLKGNLAAKNFQAELNSLDRTIEDLEDQIKSATDSGEINALQAKKAAAEQAKGTVNFSKAINVASTSLVNFGFGALKTVTDTMMNSTIDFVKGLQDGQSGVSLYSGLEKKRMQMNTDLMTSAGDGISTMGGALVAVNPLLGILTIAVGKAISIFASMSGKLGQAGLDVLQKEIEKTTKAYSENATSGALFADGMTGMRNASAQAGLQTQEFADVIKSQSANIAASGLGMTGGIKQLGDVKSAMKKSGIESSLMNLGYGFKEQAELVAQTQADMARSGKAGTTEQVAQQTKEYAQNLRLISNLTGEDAKAKMKQVREQNNFLAFQNKLSELGPEQAKKIEDGMASLNAADRKALQDRIINNGVVIDRDAALYEASNKGAQAQNDRLYELYKQGELNNSRVVQTQGEYADSVLEGVKANQSAAIAARYSGSEAAKSIAQSNLEGRATAIKINKDTVAAANNALNGAENTTDPLTKTVNDLEVNAQKFKVSLEQELTPAIQTFASQLKKSSTDLSDMLKDLGIKKEGPAEKEGKWAGALAGMWAGGAVGAGVGGVAGLGIGAIPGAIAGGVIGGVGGYLAGGAGGRMADNHDDTKSGAIKPLGALPQAADGGVFNGPTSGFPVMLHGFEAVIPMNDNVTQTELPNTLTQTTNVDNTTNNTQPPVDLTGLTTALEQLITTAKDQLNKHDDMLRAMNDTKDATERLYHAMS